MYINIWTQLAKLMRKVNKMSKNSSLLWFSEIWWNIEIFDLKVTGS